MLSFISFINDQMRNKSKYLVGVFAVNATLFGLANMVSIFTKRPEVVNNYPLATIFLWSFIVMIFLAFDLRKMFYFNSVPIVLFSLTVMIFPGQQQSAEQASSSWPIEYTLQLIIMVAFFIIGLFYQVRDTSAAVKYRKQKKKDTETASMEEDLERAIYEEYNDHQGMTIDPRFKPVNDASVWVDKAQERKE